MASRIEEKKARREEREAKEAAARATQQRQRQLQILATVVLVVVAAGAVVFAVTRGGSDSNSTANGGLGNSSSPLAPTDAIAQIPPASDKNLAKAAKAAGCVIMHPAEEGHEHVPTPVTYHSNPPTSGNHNPDPALDGVYSPGNEPAKEHFVHTLEHGRIELQYRPGTSRKIRLQLQTLLAEAYNGHPGGYKMLLFENPTKMPYAVAATAWTQLIGCPTVNKNTWDALRDFRNTYVDHGRENLPPNDL